MTSELDINIKILNEIVERKKVYKYIWYKCCNKIKSVRFLLNPENIAKFKQSREYSEMSLPNTIILQNLTLMLIDEYNNLYKVIDGYILDLEKNPSLWLAYKESPINKNPELFNEYYNTVVSGKLSLRNINEIIGCSIIKTETIMDFDHEVIAGLTNLNTEYFKKLIKSPLELILKQLKLTSRFAQDEKEKMVLEKIYHYYKYVNRVINIQKELTYR